MGIWSKSATKPNPFSPEGPPRCRGHLHKPNPWSRYVQSTAIFELLPGQKLGYLLEKQRRDRHMHHHLASHSPIMWQRGGGGSCGWHLTKIIKCSKEDRWQVCWQDHAEQGKEELRPWGGLLSLLSLLWVWAPQVENLGEGVAKAPGKQRSLLPKPRGEKENIGQWQAIEITPRTWTMREWKRAEFVRDVGPQSTTRVWGVTPKCQHLSKGSYQSGGGGIL